MDSLSSLSSFLPPLPNGSQTSLLDMNDDVFHFHLFNYLDLDDILELRFVCKKLYSVVKDYHACINDLCFLCYYNRDKPKGNWFATTKSIKFKNQLSIFKIPLLSKPENNLINLKFLRIENCSSSLFKFDNLNKFTKLQILVIDSIDIRSDNQLALPNLAALSLGLENLEIINCDHIGSLMIDTPKLHSLHVCCLNMIDSVVNFKTLEPVKYLRLNYYDENISMFSNLECLEFVDEVYPDAEHLLTLKNLKTFRINTDYLENIDIVKELFTTKKDDLEMVLSGVKIKELSKIDEYASKYDLKFQMDNYDELEDNLDFATDVDYEKLVERVPHNQMPNLINKFSNIQRLRIASAIQDVDGLISFMQRCPNLSRLDIRRASLDQQFFDQLPSISLLSVLEIKDNDYALDFDFVMKIHYLRYFTVDQDVLLDDRFNFNNLKYLKVFAFPIRKKKIIIDKISIDRYTVFEREEPAKFNQKYYSQDQVIEFTNYLRDNHM